jgi:hypothetical protein
MGKHTSEPKGRIVVPELMYGLKPVPTSPYLPAATYQPSSGDVSDAVHDEVTGVTEMGFRHINLILRRA